MQLKMKKLKERMARLMLAAFIFHIGTGSAQAVPIAVPTGDINLTVLAAISAQLNSAVLVKWRTGVANQIPQPAAGMTFQYLQTGTGLGLPSKTNIVDNSANNQGDLWSDNAVKVDYVKGNTLASSILIYTDNAANDNQDPIGNASLRGGLVGCQTTQTLSGGKMVCSDPHDPARASVIPLLWKAVAEADLAKVSTATVNNVARAIATNHPLFMYTEVVAQTGGACPVEGANATGPSRINNGFCDFSTHYFVDKNNTDPNNQFYTNYTGVKRNQVFDYTSLIGAFGVNTTEQGAGAGLFSPAYAVIGSNFTNSIQAHYGTTIYVEVLSR